MCELVEVTTNVAGRGRAIRKGTVVCADDPRIKGASHVRPLAVQHYCGEGSVEQMTAAPGEKRDVAVFRCDQCDATAKSPAGLAAHKRSHGIDGEQ